MNNSSQIFHRLSGTHDTTAVGLIATKTNDEETAVSIRRAVRLGYDVFVAHPGIPDAKSVRTAKRFGARLVDSTDGVGSIDALHAALLEAADENDYSGIVVQTDPSQPIAFERKADPNGRASKTAFDADESDGTDAFLDVDSGDIVDVAPDDRSATTTARMDGIVVGIPAYNEEVGIGSTVLSAQRYAEQVIVVDDGSSDGTASIAQNAGATVIEHETNRGKGGAIQTLFEYSRTVEFDVLVLMDADGQHVTGDIRSVANSVLEGDTDLVIGSRYLSPSEDDETPAYRRFGQKVLDYLTIHSSDVSLTDTQSGFRALSAETVETIRLRTNGIGVESEMVDQAVRNGLSIREVPIDVRYEGIDGQTYNPIHHGSIVALYLVQLVRDRHPLVFFGLPGLLFILAGTLYGMNAILIYQATDNFYPSKVLVAGFVTILGVLGVFCGLILNRIADLIRQQGVGR
ncbi:MULTISPECIES: glycosyltransferase family 2 protein [unclassified Haladaptatus]|uniref:glycosyltransferase family 2 protein n=1 Tax=unclassified Haladaptatus TaxID=2622732 RepID=UPI00209C336E|nr:MULTISPECIES: glycosyltransferase family 2 protein [unclassified Haladaptatus]MCO8245575.1 glycosyltransferase family 2 protein [Haladaptatus sp. AB643]MCO8255403.1 glycosyltransferase family 2 protein [Haladaptatus sp. AB618]